MQEQKEIHNIHSYTARIGKTKDWVEKISKVLGKVESWTRSIQVPIWT